MIWIRAIILISPFQFLDSKCDTRGFYTKIDVPSFCVAYYEDNIHILVPIEHRDPEKATWMIWPEWIGLSM